jgi:hypothetical protein
VPWVVALHKHGRWGEIVNGTRATITEVDREAVTITVRTDAGAELGRWAPALGCGVWRRSTASWWPRTRISSSLAASPWAIRRGADGAAERQVGELRQHPGGLQAISGGVTLPRYG